MSHAITDEHTPERRPHPEGGEHGEHPSDMKYVLIALILSAITAVEVAISYIKGLKLAGNPLLIILAVAKFSIVVLFFMHLKFDNRVLRRLFVTGIILAIAIYTAVLFMFHVFS
jgi:cytochrome c oxidase subunit 4